MVKDVHFQVKIIAAVVVGCFGAAVVVVGEFVMVMVVEVVVGVGGIFVIFAVMVAMVAYLTNLPQFCWAFNLL